MRGAHRSRCRWRWPPGSARGANAARPARAGSSGPPGRPCPRGTRGCRGAAAGTRGGKPASAGTGQDESRAGTGGPTVAAQAGDKPPGTSTASPLPAEEPGLVWGHRASPSTQLGMFGHALRKGDPWGHEAPASPSHPPGGGAERRLLPCSLWLVLLPSRPGQSQGSRPGHPAGTQKGQGPSRWPQTQDRRCRQP